MEKTFICHQCVCEEVADEDYLMVGFADSASDDPAEYLILQLGLSFDEQDVALGMDACYLEYVSDETELSGYGLCSSIEPGEQAIRFRFKPNEAGIETLTVDLAKQQAEYAAPQFRAMLDRIIGSIR